MRLKLDPCGFNVFIMMALKTTPHTIILAEIEAIPFSL